MEKIDLQCLKDKIIENSKVYLRLLRKDDLESFWKISQGSSHWKHFTHNLSNRETLEEWVEGVLKDYETNERVPFTIIDKESGKIVGSTSVLNFSGKDKNIEIASTWLGTEFKGKGLIQTSNKLVMNCCFNDLEVERIDFKVDVLNVTAKKSLIKISGVQENNEFTDDQNVFYSIYKKDFRLDA